MLPVIMFFAGVLSGLALSVVLAVGMDVWGRRND